MPVIEPFQGWRYRREKIRRPADVLAPPYDVISGTEQEELHRRSPYNVVRLILGLDERGDNVKNNKYTRAGKLLRQWISSGILAKDQAPAIYVVVQDYKEGLKPRTRIGFMAAMKIDERGVLRHENTLAKPKKDRLALLKEVRANLSPIFGLIEDKKGAVDRLLKMTLKSAPTVDVKIHDVRHRLYVEHRPKFLKKLKKEMQAKPVYIADGHHRFEVACRFRDWMRRKIGRSATKTSADPSAANAADWNYVMTYFSDFAHNPFAIFPTHRLIRVSKVLKDPLTLLGQRGTLEKVGGLPAVLSRLSRIRERTRHPGRYRFGIYTKKNTFYIFTLDKSHSRTGDSPAAKLDVAVLHERVLEPCFHLEAIEKSRAIDFTRDPRHAVAEVKNGRFDMAFFLRPTSLKEMIDVSKKGLRMPQKSTYFYPKLLSGLVFHCFDPNGP